MTQNCVKMKEKRRKHIKEKRKGALKEVNSRKATTERSEI